MVNIFANNFPTPDPKIVNFDNFWVWSRNSYLQRCLAYFRCERTFQGLYSACDTATISQISVFRFCYFVILFFKATSVTGKNNDFPLMILGGHKIKIDAGNHDLSCNLKFILGFLIIRE
jgi:hypothetical protein